MAVQYRATEDAQEVRLGAGLWQTATGLGTYRIDLADPVSGTVGYIGEVLEGEGKVTIALRLKVADRKITEVEAILGRGRVPGTSIVPAPRASFGNIVPPAERLTRQQMIETANANFDALLVAGAATYAMVLLLSKTANFTLTLPGIAGLIVAVGITADSFIVYFERIRDEMRDGRSMRVAVEAGWVRARATCLAADAVSLLAAVVLYIFAAGVVRGFAFALGLSTIIDLVVFFWFTKPLVSVLARYKFFNGGGKLSGLSAETLGIDKIATDRPRAAAATRSSVPTAAEGGTV